MTYGVDLNHGPNFGVHKGSVLDHYLSIGSAERLPPIGDEAENYQFGHRIGIYRRKQYSGADRLTHVYFIGCECGWLEEYATEEKLRGRILHHQQWNLDGEGIPL